MAARFSYEGASTEGLCKPRCQGGAPEGVADVRAEHSLAQRETWMRTSRIPEYRSLACSRPSRRAGGAVSRRAPRRTLRPGHVNRDGFAGGPRCGGQ